MWQAWILKWQLLPDLAMQGICLNKVKSGEASYHFIEIMGCPGGCVNGGGQPQVSGDVRNFTDVRAIRAGVLYRNDQAKINP